MSHYSCIWYVENILSYNLLTYTFIYSCNLVTYPHIFESHLTIHTVYQCIHIYISCWSLCANYLICLHVAMYHCMHIYTVSFVDNKAFHSLAPGMAKVTAYYLHNALIAPTGRQFILWFNLCQGLRTTESIRLGAQAHGSPHLSQFIVCLRQFLFLYRETYNSVPNSLTLLEVVYLLFAFCTPFLTFYFPVLHPHKFHIISLSSILSLKISIVCPPALCKSVTCHGMQFLPSCTTI
jgi:hypothetical protein